VKTLVVSGQLNKQSAAELEIGEVTAKVDLAAVLRKLQADSLAELVRTAGELDVLLRK
jgi:FixJ family two-component response regulator